MKNIYIHGMKSFLPSKLYISFIKKKQFSFVYYDKFINDIHGKFLER